MRSLASSNQVLRSNKEKIFRKKAFLGIRFSRSRSTSSEYCVQNKQWIQVKIVSF